MSLAMFAAPFDENIIRDMNDENIIHKKRQNNKTQKMYPSKENFDTQKVQSIIRQLHNKTNDDDQDQDEDQSFPPYPQSSGVEKKKRENTTTSTKEPNKENMDNRQHHFLGKAPQPNSNEHSLEVNHYQSNYYDTNGAEEYYKKVLPGYTGQYNRPYYNSSMNSSTPSGSEDILLQKLNYMIHLLEEKQDEKTNNVTEEVVIYYFYCRFFC
jgi:hypothetical protein